MIDKSKTRADTESVFIGEERKHYRTKFKLGNNKEFECLSKKQIKVLYPSKDFDVVAEYAAGSTKSPEGSLEYKNTKLNLSKYKTYNRAIYREKGFISVGDDSYVVLLKNVISIRIIAAVFCVAVIAAGLILAVNLTKPVEAENVGDELIAAGGIKDEVKPELEEGAVDWEGAKPRETGSVSVGIAIPGYKSITIDAGVTDVKVNLQNPAGNPCYFVISLLLDDGTQLYKSKMVEPGKGLYEITLSRALEEGEYGAKVKYETFSLDELNSLNGAEVKITLIAQ